MSTWVKVPHLGTIHLVSISKFLPFLPPIKRPAFPAFAGFQYLSLQFFASILFQYLHFPSECPSTIFSIHFVSYVAPPWPLCNFLQASCFSIPKLSRACASRPLPAFMWFLPLVSPQLLACVISQQLTALILLSYLNVSPPRVISISCIHLVSYISFPPLSSPQFFACTLFQYPNLSCTHVPLSNFPHAFGFNILPSSVSQHFFALTWFQYLTFPLCLSSHVFNFLQSLGFNMYALQGVQRPSPCNTLGSSPPSHATLFSISTLHTTFGLSVAQGLNLVSSCVKVPHLGAYTWFQYLGFPPCYLSVNSCIRSFGLKTSPLGS